MDIAAPKGSGDLGFDTSINGPIKVEWGGPATDIASSVLADVDLKFSPTGSKRKGALNDIPVSGQALAHYDGKTEVVRIEKVQLFTPQSTLNASGVLGVNKGDPLTSLHADVTVRDLGEYNQLLTTLGVQANGKKGSCGTSHSAAWHTWLQRLGFRPHCGPGSKGPPAGHADRSKAWDG